MKDLLTHAAPPPQKTATSTIVDDSQAGVATSS